MKFLQRTPLGTRAADEGPVSLGNYASVLGEPISQQSVKLRRTSRMARFAALIVGVLFSILISPVSASDTEPQKTVEGEDVLCTRNPVSENRIMIMCGVERHDELSADEQKQFAEFPDAEAKKACPDGHEVLRRSPIELTPDSEEPKGSNEDPKEEKKRWVPAGPLLIVRCS